MKHVPILFAILVLFATFAVFSRYVKKGVFRDIDFALTVKIQEGIDKSAHLRTSALVGDILEGAVILASPGISVAVVLVLTGWAAATGKGNKKIAAILIPVVFAGLVMAEMYGKSVVHHPSPPFMFLKNPTTHFPVYYSVEDYSYPSGHAGRAVFLSLTALSVLFLPHPSRRKFAFAAFVFAVYAVLVSTSVIYLGHHWASDVVGGWMIGGAFVLVWAAGRGVRVMRTGTNPSEGNGLSGTRRVRSQP